MTLPERIDEVRLAILEGRVQDASDLSLLIEAEAGGFPPPDPRALRRALVLLQATVTGLRSAAARLSHARGEGLASDVYDARGRRQRHAPARPPAGRW
jgi:hypothetical protein